MRIDDRKVNGRITIDPQGTSESGVQRDNRENLDRHRGAYGRGDPGHSPSVGYYHG